MIEVLFAEMAKIKDRLDILETAAKEQEKAGECRHDWQVDYMGYSFCTNGCGATKPKPEPTPTVEVKEKSNAKEWSLYSSNGCLNAYPTTALLIKYQGEEPSFVCRVREIIEGQE